MPSDDITSPSDISAAYTTTTTISCPVEEERDHDELDQEREGGAEHHDAPLNSDVARAENAPARSPTPNEQEVEAGASTPSPSSETTPKHINTVEDALMRDTPSPVSQGEGKYGEASQAHAAPTPTASSPSIPSTYLGFASDSKRLLPNSTSSYLRPGSKFRGTQQSDRQTYEVQVEIKHVDMQESFLCGYLRIQGLTDDHPTLTTYFEGEIIGTKHTFKTAHPEWGSTEKVDMQHWARFPAWRPFAKQARSPNFTCKNFAQREHLFMRWKEYFLVPDHKVKSITGASFEGFYYICFNQCSGTVSGIYFHSRSEKYQQLELTHVQDHGCQAAIEFR